MLLALLALLVPLAQIMLLMLVAWLGPTVPLQLLAQLAFFMPLVQLVLCPVSAFSTVSDDSSVLLLAEYITVTALKQLALVTLLGPFALCCYRMCSCVSYCPQGEPDRLYPTVVPVKDFDPSRDAARIETAIKTKGQCSQKLTAARAGQWHR